MYFDCHVINKGEEIDNFMVTVAYKIYGDQTYLANHRLIDNNKYIYIYTMQGQGSIEIDGIEYHVKEKQLIVINAKKSVTYKTEGDKWHIWLFEYKVREHNLEINKVLNIELSPSDLQFCQLCLWNLKKGQYKQASAYFACMYYMTLERSIEKDYYKDKFVEATDYMKKHIYKCTIVEVAEEVNVNERMLRKIFRDNSGLLPKKYLDMLKIEEAKKLLELTDYLVKDIANKLGFSSPYHFCEIFKKNIGISPRQYRDRKTS